MVRSMVARDALVVDDDAAVREALSELLVTRGFTVRQAENGRIALDLIAERAPGLLVLDLEMPVMDGWEVLDVLHRTGALGPTAVLVVSATATPPPGVAFLRKPCATDELLALLGAASPSRFVEPRGALAPREAEAPTQGRAVVERD